MIKVGIIGDTHLSEQTPRSWKADYSVVTLNDLVTAVKMTDVSIILGDFFHRPVISEQYKLEVSRRLGELTTPVYTIWGNHDVEGLNLASADRTSLNLLHEFGVVKVLDKGITFDGVSFDVIEFKKNPAVPKHNKQEDGVLLGHFFFEEPSDPAFSISKDEVFNSGYKYVFLGHEHEPRPDIEGNGTVLVRQGALCRNSAHDYNLDRVPAISIVSCDNGKIVKVDRNVPIPTVQGESIFRADILRSPVKNTTTLLTSMTDLLDRFKQSDMGSNNVLTVKKALVELDTPTDVMVYLEDLYQRLGMEFK